MALARRVAIVAATVVSAPGVLLAAGACLYILYSLLTEPWYRAWFASYGTTMAALYVAFVAGVIAIASLATRRARGLLALAFELHDEADRVLPFGLLFGPYIAWVVAWMVLRSRPAPPPSPQWQDTRM